MPLTPLGWAIMLVSLAVVWGFTFWCFKKVLSEPPEEVTHPPVGLGP